MFWYDSKEDGAGDECYPEYLYHMNYSVLPAWEWTVVSIGGAWTVVLNTLGVVEHHCPIAQSWTQMWGNGSIVNAGIHDSELEIYFYGTDEIQSNYNIGITGAGHQAFLYHVAGNPVTTFQFFTVAAGAPEWSAAFVVAVGWHLCRMIFRPASVECWIDGVLMATNVIAIPNTQYMQLTSFLSTPNGFDANSYEEYFLYRRL